MLAASGRIRNFFSLNPLILPENFRSIGPAVSEPPKNKQTNHALDKEKSNYIILSSNWVVELSNKGGCTLYSFVDPDKVFS